MRGRRRSRRGTTTRVQTFAVPEGSRSPSGDRADVLERGAGSGAAAEFAPLFGLWASSLTAYTRNSRRRRGPSRSNRRRLVPATAPRRAGPHPSSRCGDTHAFGTQDAEGKAPRAALARGRFPVLQVGQLSVRIRELTCEIVTLISDSRRVLNDHLDNLALARQRGARSHLFNGSSKLANLFSQGGDLRR